MTAGLAGPTSGDGDDRRADRVAARRVLGLIAVTAALRLLLGAWLGLSVDECYTVVMGRQLELGYFDHPPLMYWLAGITSRLSGSEAPLVMRAPFVVLFAGTTWLVFRLSSLPFGPRAGAASALLLNLVLFFTVCAGGWVLPDGPLLFFSVAAVLCLARALPGPPGTTRRQWLGFGLLAGLALLSKYHAVFVLAGAGLYLLLSPSARHWIRRPEPWLALLVAAAVFSPVLLWNALSGWASFRFQGGRAGSLAEGQGSPLFDSVGGQALWTTPWIGIPLLGALLGALRRGRSHDARLLLACLGALPIGFFTGLSALGVRGLAHWPLPGYFFLVPLLGAALSERLQAQAPWPRRWLAGSTLASAALILGLALHAKSGWISELAPRLFARGDPTHDLIPWEALRAPLARWGQPTPGVLVAGSRWSEAAKLGHLLGPGVPVTSLAEDARGFRFVWPESRQLGRDMLLVASRRDRVSEPMLAYAPYFERIRPLGSVPIRRGRRVEFLVSVYLAERLRAPIPERRRR